MTPSRVGSDASWEPYVPPRVCWLSGEVMAMMPAMMTTTPEPEPLPTHRPTSVAPTAVDQGHGHEPINTLEPMASAQSADVFLPSDPPGQQTLPHG